MCIRVSNKPEKFQSRFDQGFESIWLRAGTVRITNSPELNEIGINWHRNQLEGEWDTEREVDVFHWVAFAV